MGVTKGFENTSRHLFCGDKNDARVSAGCQKSCCLNVNKPPCVDNQVSRLLGECHRLDVPQIFNNDSPNNAEEIIKFSPEKCSDKFLGKSCGISRIVVICVWLLSSFGSVIAAPSFFDDSRRSFDPLKCGCSGGGSKRARVVGGSELSRGSAPWLVAITKNGRSHCGSTLISPRHILSAAHCVEGVNIVELRGWLGVHAMSEAHATGKGLRFSNAFPHPNFQIDGFHNDIAVLEFQHGVQFSSLVKPICLPARGDAEYTGRTAIVAGWGKTAERDPPSDVPRQALVQIWSKSKCKNSGYPAKKVSGEIICAGLTKGGVDACQGDSGGPLVLEGAHGTMEIIGVVSWGRGCARPNLPGIYTRVASYLPFIHNIIASSCTL